MSNAGYIYRDLRNALLTSGTILVVTLLVATNYGLLRQQLRAAAPAHIHSIAVLPFLNLTGAHSEDYLANALGGALAAELPKNAKLKVITPPAAITKIDKPLGQIARNLHVDAVIVGLVRCSGNRLRVQAEMSDAADNTLWSEAYDRAPGDIASAASEIARSIARLLN